MPEESNDTDRQADESVAQEATKESKAPEEVAEDGGSGAEDEQPAAADSATASSGKKKKKSKKKKLKEAITGQKSDDGSKTLNQEQLAEILKSNPSLKNELGGVDVSKAEEMMNKLTMSDLLTGMVCFFWPPVWTLLTMYDRSQSVVKIRKIWPATSSGILNQFQVFVSLNFLYMIYFVLTRRTTVDQGPVEEGPIKTIDPESIPKEPPAFAVDGFKWVTMDLTDDKQVSDIA